MKVATLLFTTFCLFALQTHQADADVICAGDDFNDNVKNTNLWGADSQWAAGGSLVEINGRLHYLGTAGAFRPYAQSYRSYSRNWEVIADVGLGNVGLSQPNSHVEMFLAVMNRGDTNLYNGNTGGDHLSIALDIYRDSAGQVERSFEAYFRTNWVEIKPRPEVFTTSQQASFRFTFDATTKTLTTYYDENGNAGGYTWTPLRSVQVNAPGSDWQMTSNSMFTLFLGGSSESFDVTTNHLVYADNFSVCDDLASPRLLLTQGSDTPQVTIQGSVGTHLKIQSADVLSTNTSWLTLTNLVLTNSTHTISDTSASGVSRRFYRAKLTP